MFGTGMTASLLRGFLAAASVEQRVERSFEASDRAHVTRSHFLLEHVLQIVPGGGGSRQAPYEKCSRGIFPPHLYTFKVLEIGC